LWTDQECKDTKKRKEKGDYEGSKRSLRHAERSAGNRAVVPGRVADGILRKWRNKE